MILSAASRAGRWGTGLHSARARRRVDHRGGEDPPQGRLLGLVLPAFVDPPRESRHDPGLCFLDNGQSTRSCAGYRQGGVPGPGGYPTPVAAQPGRSLWVRGPAGLTVRALPSTLRLPGRRPRARRPGLLLRPGPVLRSPPPAECRRPPGPRALRPRQVSPTRPGHLRASATSCSSVARGDRRAPALAWQTRAEPPHRPRAADSSSPRSLLVGWT